LALSNNHSFTQNEFQADERDEIVLFKFDGQVLTLLRFCVKSFARGVDEKSGCFSKINKKMKATKKVVNFRASIFLFFGKVVPSIYDIRHYIFSVFN
jgi:hypothetical protein